MLGVEAPELDAPVRRAANTQASNVNNSGVQGQVAYLISQLGFEQAEEVIHQAALPS